MDVSTPPSLDLACPQAEADIEKHVYMVRERGVDKNKIGTQQDHAYYHNSNKLYHMNFHEQVTIHHNIEVKSINSIENQQTMLSVNFATSLYHLFRKGLVSKHFGKSTYSTIIQSSMIANTHRIHMSKMFQPDTQIGAYCFASQRIHLKGDVNNNNSCSFTSNWIYVPRSFLTT